MTNTNTNTNTKEAVTLHYYAFKMKRTITTEGVMNILYTAERSPEITPNGLLQLWNVARLCIENIIRNEVSI